MRHLFWSKIFWSMGFWVVLVGAAAMLTGWPAGADPAHGVPGLSSGGLPSGGLSSGGLPSGHAQCGLISYVHSSETNPTLVILIDPAQRVMSVYHIDRDSGEIQIKSVRKFSWDLSLTDYNTSNPMPEEIRNGLQRQ